MRMLSRGRLGEVLVAEASNKELLVLVLVVFHHPTELPTSFHTSVSKVLK